MGCDPDEYCRQIVVDIDRGSPLDYVSTWYPRFYLIYAAFNTVSLIISGGTVNSNLIHQLVSPFLFLLWMCLCAWMHRVGHRLSLRFGVWIELGWNILLIAAFIWLCFMTNKLLNLYSVPMSLWLVVPYQLALAAASQYWQNSRYNRYARNHPWREQTQQ